MNEEQFKKLSIKKKKEFVISIISQEAVNAFERSEEVLNTYFDFFSSEKVSSRLEDAVYRISEKYIQRLIRNSKDYTAHAGYIRAFSAIHMALYSKTDFTVNSIKKLIKNFFDKILNKKELLEAESIKVIYNGEFSKKFRAALDKALLEVKQVTEKALVINAEAPKNSPLGQIAWGDERNLPEKNNAVEKKLYDALEDHIDNNQMMNKPTAQIFMKILKKNLYKKVIKEQTKPIYRGIAVSEEILRKLLGVDKKFVIKDKGDLDVDVNVKPKYGYASSWSAVRDIAKQFSGGGMTSGAEKLLYSDNAVYAVILKAFPEDNNGQFLDLSAIYKELQDTTVGSYRYEKETIALGPVNVTRVSWKRVK